MKLNMKYRAGSGRLQPAPNEAAKALASPLFRQRIVKPKKAYKRQQNQTLSKIEQNQ
jgi:stalled ribosome alternative rescue factor ArfA